MHNLFETDSSDRHTSVLRLFWSTPLVHLVLCSAYREKGSFNSPHIHQYSAVPFALFYSKFLMYLPYYGYFMYTSAGPCAARAQLPRWQRTMKASWQV